MFFKKPDPKDDPRNRRRFDRIPARNLVRILRESGEELERLSNVFDLSVGGVRIVCHEALPANTVLRIILNIPEKEATLELRARVAWTCPMKGQKGAYFAGVEFMNMADKDRDILQEIVSSKFRKEP